MQTVILSFFVSKDYGGAIQKDAKSLRPFYVNR